jgi:hypothetical protein
MNRLASVTHPDRPTVHVHGFPAGALRTLADELAGFGAQVIFSDDTHGELLHQDGRLIFEHAGDILFVTVIQKPTYFPLRMLVGGIRQTAQEAAERFVSALSGRSPRLNRNTDLIPPVPPNLAGNDQTASIDLEKGLVAK